MQDALRITGDHLFAVDLTSMETLSNTQIDQLLDSESHFQNWRRFVRDSLPAHAIPVIHLTDPFDPGSVAAQINDLRRRHSLMAVRIPSEFEELEGLVASLEREWGGNLEGLIVYADVGMVTPRATLGAQARLNEVCAAFSELSPSLFVPLASSFPSTVAPYGDVHGEFPLQEVVLSELLKQDFDDINCIHGDYACIHPQDMEGMAINWVPRVDVPLDASLFYYRYRRNEGSYVRAAREALSDAAYVPLDCWGQENLRNAAAGNPPGRSPAHWISVRLNYHIERQLERLA